MSNTTAIRNPTGRIGFATALCVVAIMLSSTEAAAQTVISKSRIGGYAEDITYVSRGRLRDSIILLDGFDVFSVENARRPRGPLTRLFGIKIPELNLLPTGITYIESEGLFAFNDRSQPTKLFLFDEKGEFKGTRTIQYLNSAYVPGHMEGLAYIPSGSPTFPDHLIAVVFDTLGGPVRLEVIRRDGVVVAEIFRSDWPSNFNLDVAGMGDVAFLAPNRLLVTTYDNSMWTMDFSGNILSGPLVVSGASGSEGITQMNDDRIVVVNFPQSLMFFDENLNRVPESDRNDIIGLNLNTPRGVAWNTDTNQLLISHALNGLQQIEFISSVPVTVDGATQVVNLSGLPQGARLTYLPAEHLIAMAHANNPRAIMLFNSDGTVNSQIDLSLAALGQNLGPPNQITYIPPTNEFVVGFNGVNGDPGQPAERRRLRVFSRTGTLVRTLDLTCTGTNGLAGLAYFDDPAGGGGRFMFLGSSGRVVVTDLNGDSRNTNGLLLGEFNSRAKLGLLGPTDITAITTGPQAGAFAIIDSSAGEIVIFRLN